MFSQSAPPSRARCCAGIQKEAAGLSWYQGTTGRPLERPETLVRVLSVGGVKISVSGRPDGVDGDTIVEHKYRVKGLLGFVPAHERAQCYLYMVLFGKPRACLVETFGQHARMHVFAFDQSAWDDMAARMGEHVRAASDLRARRLRGTPAR